MCSINGAYRLGMKPIMSSVMTNIIVKAERRGRDSFGVAAFTLGAEEGLKYYRKTGKASEYQARIYEYLSKVNASIVISNNRAEPTTEYVLDKTHLDVQPFANDDGSINIVHNGTIANDKDIIEKYNLKEGNLGTQIDSAVIPHVLEKAWNGVDRMALAYVLMEELVGSYSLAIHDKRSPKTLWLATNYKPLFLLFQNDVVYFTSQKDSFEFDELNEEGSIVEVKPYTLLEVTTAGIFQQSLYKIDHKVLIRKRKALIVASAGLDSTVCAQWAVAKGYDITLLHFKYQCRAEEAEVRQIKALQKHFGCELIEFPADFFKDIIKHSRLTGEGESLMKEGAGEASAELAYEWVPARNLIFLSLAAGYAEAYKYDYMILGGNLEESGAYADNEWIFQKKLNDLLPNALNLQNKLEILTPIADLMKHEIVKMGVDLGAPLDLTWSCYENGTTHCGECGPCYMRRMAFKMNHIKDMIPYIKVPEGQWDDCSTLELKDNKWVKQTKL